MWLKMTDEERHALSDYDLGQFELGIAFASNAVMDITNSKGTNRDIDADLSSMVKYLDELQEEVHREFCRREKVRLNCLTERS